MDAMLEKSGESSKQPTYESHIAVLIQSIEQKLDSVYQRCILWGEDMYVWACRGTHNRTALQQMPVCFRSAT